MKRRRGEMLEQLRDADPFPASGAEGWSETPEGKAIAERVRHEMTSSSAPAGPAKLKRRRGPLLLAAALAALLAIGASFAVLHRHPASSTVVGCYRDLGQEARTYGVAVQPGGSPTNACSAAWRNMFNVSAPTRLTECVIEEGGVGVGGIGVFPYPDSMDAREACISIGASLPDASEGPGG